VQAPFIGALLHSLLKQSRFLDSPVFWIAALNEIMVLNWKDPIWGRVGGSPELQLKRANVLHTPLLKNNKFSIPK